MYQESLILKWFMSSVLPGVALVFASPLCSVSIFMRLDFPTLLRPIKASSALSSFGHCESFAELMVNSAFFISIIIGVWSVNLMVGSTHLISFSWCQAFPPCRKWRGRHPPVGSPAPLRVSVPLCLWACCPSCRAPDRAVRAPQRTGVRW